MLSAIFNIVALIGIFDYDGTSLLNGFKVIYDNLFVYLRSYLDLLLYKKLALLFTPWQTSLSKEAVVLFTS